MDVILVRGPARLRGKVRVAGSKNAVLPILAASLLAEGETVLHEVPSLDDVFTMAELLTSLGARVEFTGGGRVVIGVGALAHEAHYEQVRRMRASFLVMGPLLARLGRATIALPGGCAIGSRPIDLHLKGLAELGASIECHHGHVRVERPPGGLVGTNVYLDYPSVGATENLLMAACLAQGRTVIENAAVEPEVQDLVSLLKAMGARIGGEGTRVLTVDGVPALRPVEHTVIPDRIEAGTFMVAAAATGGDLLLENIDPEHLQAVTAKLREAGTNITTPGVGSLHVQGPDRLLGVDVKTLPYPGFPTDMQPQFMAALAVARGSSVVTETVFENRFMHVDELKRMGANIKVEGNCAVVRGVTALSAAEVRATDLRAAAGLVLAGLLATGLTRVVGARHLDRGYENLVYRLSELGVDVRREFD